MFTSLSRTQNCWSLNCFICYLFISCFFKCSFLVSKNDSNFFFQHPTDLSFANTVCKPSAPLLCDFLALYFKEKCQGSSYWPLRLARIAAFRKHFRAVFSSRCEASLVHCFADYFCPDFQEASSERCDIQDAVSVLLVRLPGMQR